MIAKGRNSNADVATEQDDAEVVQGTSGLGAMVISEYRGGIGN
jgi:hypothetical protein